MSSLNHSDVHFCLQKKKRAKKRNLKSREKKYRKKKIFQKNRVLEKLKKEDNTKYDIESLLCTMKVKHNELACNCQRCDIRKYKWQIYYEECDYCRWDEAIQDYIHIVFLSANTTTDTPRPCPNKSVHKLVSYSENELDEEKSLTDE
jgi:hypothetical protein